MQESETQVGEFLSDAQLCAMLRVTPRTTARWRVEGNGLPFVRAGARRVLYKRSDVESWIASQTFAHRAAEAVHHARTAT
jgi:excisionase family DNA binding protein